MIQNIVRVQLWESFGKYYPIVKASREASGLVLIIGGGEYLYYNDRRYRLGAGDLVCFRQGDSYRIELENSYIKCYVINFQWDAHTPTFPLYSCGDLTNQFVRLHTLWTRMRNEEYDSLESMGLLYQLLAEIFRRRSNSGIPRRKKERIQPAVKYLQDNFAQQELRISHLCELCGLTERSPRRLFQEVYGLSPKQYLSEQRIRYAKKLLIDGCSIGEAALLCGFHDVYTFSSFFKRNYGASPREYARSASGETLL